LQVTSSAATAGSISDGANLCSQAAGGGTNTCGPFAESSSPLSITKGGAGTAWTWGGACAGCGATTSPCSLALTSSPLTCSLTITAP
jgi:hypothetical protein